MSNDTEANRALVLEAMTTLFQHKDARAVERLYAPDYIQHNPGIAQGRDALAKLVARLPASVYYEPGLVIAEGAYVAIHGRIRGWAPRPQVVVDIFRIEDGRLAEHWDVMQDEASVTGSTSGVAMFAPDEASAQASSQAPRSGADVAIDYDALMQANLTRVFGERDAERRMAAIRELYTADAVLHEPNRAVRGHDAICEAVTTLLGSLPPGFGLTASGPAIGLHGVGRLRWSLGLPGHPAAATGLDVAEIRGGRIHSLFVLLDPPGA